MPPGVRNQRRGRDEIDHQQERRDQARRRQAARQRHEDQRRPEAGEPPRRSRDKAIVQIANARAGRDIWRDQAPKKIHPRKTPPVFLVTSATILAPTCVDFLVGHGLFARLHGDGNGDRLPAVVDALAFVDIEHGDVGDQLLVDALRRAHDIASLDGAIDDEGEIA